MNKQKADEQSLEITLGNLLRTGVFISVGTVLLGGILNLLRHGSESLAWEKFHGEPAALRGLSGIVDAALAAQGKGIIQLGLILLVAIPVLRVAVSMFTFMQKRDFVFVALTFLVLLVLSYSLFFVS
jgi:uncharacterized membrane protein